MKVTPEMVNRFLGWKLPENFSPDGGVSFVKPFVVPAYQKAHWPSGTNLLNAEQARAMLEYVLEHVPEPHQRLTPVGAGDGNTYVVG